MSKIELKLTPDQIVAVAKLLEQVTEASLPSSTQDKVNKSISFDLLDKFTSKKSSVKKANSLFDFKKRHKMSFKYHEANTLFEVINQFLPSIDKEQKAYHDLFSLNNNLHQKLV